MKKLILIVMICLSAIVAKAQIESGRCGDNATYQFNTTTGELRIEGTGDLPDDFHEGYSNEYKPVERIKYAIVGEGITGLGNYQFCDAKNMEHITLPSTLKRIKWNVIYDCHKLKEITILENVEYISDWAFGYNGELKKFISLIREPNREGIKEGSFYGIEPDQTTLYVPDEVIGKYKSSDAWKTFKIKKTLSQYEEERAREEEERAKRIAGVEIISQHKDYERGEKTRIIHSVYPATAENQKVYFETSDKQILEVDAKTGEATCISPGTARITVTTEEGRFTDYVDITVKENNNSYLKSLTSSIAYKPAFNKDINKYRGMGRR